LGKWLELMRRWAIPGAIAVVADERLVGIFTERDLVFRVVARGLDVNATPIADV